MAAPPASPRHLDALDGLRAIAIVLVMLFHTDQGGPFTGGFLGVDVFFVLSGFLITGQLLRPGWTLPVFFARRLARLWPALLAVVAFAAVDVLVLGGGSGRALLISPLYVYNEFVAYHAPLGDDTLVSHTWSLAVEVQFYFAWALALAVIRKRVGLTARRVLVVALTVAGASYAVRALYAVAFNDPWRGYFATESRLDGLMIGSALAALLAVQRRRIPQWILLALAVALAVASLTAHERSASGILGYSLIGTTTAAVVVWLTVTNPGAAMLRPLAVPAVVLLGQWSYSLYLWHQPVFVLVKFHTPLHGAAAVAAQWSLSLLVAAASFYAIETPSRLWLYRRIDERAARSDRSVRGVELVEEQPRDADQNC